MKKILAFSGSNSRNSINKKLVVATSKLIKDHEITIIDLNDFEVPLYGVDKEKEIGMPQLIEDLHKIFLEHDAFIIACPEYNGFMPAAFKNIVDWISRISRPIFQDKPMFLMATSPGARGGATNLKYISEAFSFRGGQIIAQFSLPSFNDNFNSETDTLSNDQQLNLLQTELNKFQEHLDQQ